MAAACLRNNLMDSCRPSTRLPCLFVVSAHNADKPHLLYCVAMVHIQVHIHDAAEAVQQAQDGQHHVVDVAEAGRYRFVCVVAPAVPGKCGAGFA